MPLRRHPLSRTQQLVCGRWEANDLLVPVRISLGRSKPGLMVITSDYLKFRVTAAPVDGKANEQVIKLLAKEFAVARSAINIERGHTQRNKLIRIACPTHLPASLTTQADASSNADHN